MHEKTKNAQRADTQEELFEYLVGTKDYAYRNPYADTPTYPTDVFASLVDWYEHAKYPHIWVSFRESLLRVSTDKKCAWLGLYYLVAYMRYATREHLVASKDLLGLASTICTNLVQVKESLLRNKQWGGQAYANGLWGDVERMVRNINEEFSLDLMV
jgi:hypothetical protein